MLAPGGFNFAQKRKPFGHSRCDGLFRIDVLARCQSLAQCRQALMGRGCFEEYRIIGVGQRGVEIGRPLADVVRPGNLRQPLLVAADEK